MFNSVTAYSTKENSKDIVDDLVRISNIKLGVYRPSTGILYTSCTHDKEKISDIVRGICHAFPGMELIGGTVIGGFTEDSGYIKDGYFLCLLVSDSIQFISGLIRNLSSHFQSQNFDKVVKKYFKENISFDNPAACLLFSPYNNVDANKIVDIVQNVLPPNCLTFGGITTDYWNEENLKNFSKKTPPTENTLLFFAKDDEIFIDDDSMVFLLFSGKMKVSYGVSYGWSDVGMQFPGIGEGSILKEIDGKQPHTFLREFNHPLASEENDNMEYSLWFHVPGQDPFIRDIYYDRASGKYYTKGASLPSHFHVSFSFPSKENVLKEFKNNLSKLEDTYSLVISITCCMHQVVYDQDIFQECIETVRAFDQTPIICGYFFGEYGPSNTYRRSMLHSCSNITFCLQEESNEGTKRQESITTFLDGIIKEQRKEIESLQKQLRFFEESKNNKLKNLTEDCLGLLLHQSHRSLSSHAEQIGKLLKSFYDKSGQKPPYGISRNRLIEHLMPLKKRAQKISRK